jgi:hypothetical protein
MTTAAASAALANLGADLSVSISFSVASELVAAAREAQMGDDELVAILIAFVVVVTSARGAVGKLSKWVERHAGHAAIADGSKGEGQRGMLEFGLLMLSIAQRIGLSISVQVLALSVRANQPSRVVRVVTLLGVVVFFVFFEAATSGRRPL